MEPLLNFGVSQDDALTEQRALDIQSGDRLLCIASAGEMPLNLAALNDIKIDAVDISLPQIYLTKFKWHAALHLEPVEAAKLIGYMPADNERQKLFDHLKGHMQEDEKLFWEEHDEMVRRGPVNVARFEQYIKKVSWIGVLILGKKKLQRLFDIDDLQDRRDYFDRHLASRRLKKIFNIAFHPKIYHKRGMADEGLVHSGERNIAEFFFSRFRNFCTSTPPRQNYLFQFTFFNRVLFTEALPEYLSPDGMSMLRQKKGDLSFDNVSFSEKLDKMPKEHYNKFAFSNISDWLSREEFSNLYDLVDEKAAPESRGLLRFIHYAQPVPAHLLETIKIDHDFGEKLVSMDRYPFYSLLPMMIKPGTVSDYPVCSGKSSPRIS